MVVYLMYKGSEVITVSPMPKIVYDEFQKGADYVDVWEKEKRIQRFTTAKQFHRYLNPPREAEDEQEASGYEW